MLKNKLCCLLVSMCFLFLVGMGYIYADSYKDIVVEVDDILKENKISSKAKDKYNKYITKGDFILMLLYLNEKQVGVAWGELLENRDVKGILEKFNYVDIRGYGNRKIEDSILLLHYMGIINRTAKKRIGLGDKIGREEAAKMMYMYYNYLNDMRRERGKSKKLGVEFINRLKAKSDGREKRFDFYFYHDLIYGLDNGKVLDIESYLSREEALLVIKRLYVYGDSEEVERKDKKEKNGKKVGSKITNDFDNIEIMKKFKWNLLVDSDLVKDKRYLVDKRAREYFDLANKERKKLGRRKFRYSFNLGEYANVRAKELKVKFSHERPDGSEFYSGLPYKSAISEHIGAGYSMVRDLFESWYGGDGYREDIKIPTYDKICFGVEVDNKAKSRNYYVSLIVDEYYNNIWEKGDGDVDKIIAENKKEVFRLVNEERKKAGLSELKELIEIGDYSDLRARELSISFSHNRPDGSTFASGMKYQYGVGENIAGGQMDAKRVMKEWMESKGHRENILNPVFDKMSVGFVIIPNTEFTYYWVQTFYDEV